jgi:hypothetical protein
MGIGPLEILIIIGVAALVFGAPVIFFLLGYGVGRGTAKPGQPESPPTPPPAPESPAPAEQRTPSDAIERAPETSPASQGSPDE